MVAPSQDLFLPAQTTPLSTDQIIEFTAYGYEAYMGAPPTAPCLACNVAQISLETGNGEHMQDYNAGNVKWSQDWLGNWTMFRCNEVLNGKIEWFNPPHPQTWFRAFESGMKGMQAQIEFLAGRDRYKRAWHWFMEGNPDAAVRALATAGYFTANVDAYARAVVSIYGKVLPFCQQRLGGQPIPLAQDLRDRISGIVLSSLYDRRNRDLRLHEDLVA